MSLTLTLSKRIAVGKKEVRKNEKNRRACPPLTLTLSKRIAVEREKVRVGGGVGFILIQWDVRYILSVSKETISVSKEPLVCQKRES